jgi:hypothetical protein
VVPILLEWRSLRQLEFNALPKSNTVHEHFLFISEPAIRVAMKKSPVYPPRSALVRALGL